MKIAIGMFGFTACKGGSQRAATKLANELLARGHEISIFCHDYGMLPPYPLESGVKLEFVPPKLLTAGANMDLGHVRETLSRINPDVFVSMEWHYPHILWALSCLGTGIPFICSERTDPGHMEKTWSKAGRNAVLASADIIHELSPAHTDTVPEFCRDKLRTIPNAAPLFRHRAQPGDETNPSILFLGRFVESKRAMLLLQAFANLTENFPSWSLKFRGHGSEEDNLRKAALSFGLSGRISISNPRDDVEGEYADASIYCLPTRIEGFPNSALEAMAAGLPVVAIADCPAMLPLGENGAAWLAAEATPEALAETLGHLMANAELREHAGERGLKLCETDYSHGNVHDSWETLLTEAAALKGNTIMDGFREEPFASMATLSSAARREYLYRDFGDPMPYHAHGSSQEQDIFSGIYHERQKMDCFGDISCVVRTVGERTTDACISLLDGFFGKGRTEVISREPFTVALKESLETGLKMGRPWTLIIDADVLIDAPGLAAMLNDRDNLPEKTFMHHASIMDKFFRRYRRAGNRLYRTAYLPEALKRIPSGTPLRPERDLCQAMLEGGFRCFQSYRIIGIHDHEQYFRDILRKMVLFSAKHNGIMSWLHGMWRNEPDDMDFQAALDGTLNADISGMMKIGLSLIDRLPDNVVRKWESLEKGPLDTRKITFGKVDEILKAELAAMGITPTTNTAPREYASCVELQP